MKHPRRNVLCFFLTAWSLLMFVPATVKSQSRALGTDELTTKSEVVALGRVKEMKSQWEGNKERIVTYVTLDVDEYLKGSGTGRTLTIVNPGGEVDGVGELYTHMARFKQDEDVVVFVEKDKKGHYRMTGGNDGKFAVKKDVATGMPVVSGNKSLDDFKAQIKRSAQLNKN
jgi:hypothetical protein